MNTTPSRDLSAPTVLLTGGTSLLLGTCGVVATAAYLGVDWLRTPVLGLPGGVWTIALVQAAGLALGRQHRASQSPSLSGATQGSEYEVGILAGRAAGAAWEGLRAVAASIRLNGSHFQELEDRLSIRSERSLHYAQPIRIGLEAGPEIRDVIMEQPTELPVTWAAVSPSSDNQATLRRNRMDAILRQPPTGPMLIATLEHPEREASWYDWALPRPLTYASVFPVRVDIAQVTLEDSDLKDPKQAALIAALLRAAAALSRTPGRLRLSDRLSGRLPSAASTGVRTPTGLADRAMLELAAAINDCPPTGAAKAAARAVSAWLASTDAWLDINLRRQGIENALKILGDEPEVLLRAAAIRLATFDDDSAFEALRTAERVIRAGNHEQMGEHLTFLQAEVELGLPNPLTLGRVAAGVCMVCASSPRERVAFIRGDIMDDVRHSAWLLGREQDRTVLSEVFKLMGSDRVSPSPWELRDAA